jgi:hypothetical protein
MPGVTRVEIDHELKRSLPAHGDVIQFHPLSKGHGHQSFIVETSSRANLLLKIALRRDRLLYWTSLAHSRVPDGP